MPRYSRLFLTAIMALLPLAGFGHPPEAAGREMAAAAQAWLDSLSPDQRKSAVFEFADGERENWFYVPIARKGLPLKAMNADQQKLARGLLAAGLSQRGQLQAEAIIALENVLHTMEGTAHRDPGLYYLTVFGRPAPTGTWGWRFEGHHVSVNFTLVDGSGISVTPFFFGSNPAEVRIDDPQKGRRALAEEEDQGRALMKSFNAGQQRVALIATKAPGEIITGNDRLAKLAEPAGLPYAHMNLDQQAQFRALVRVYAGRLRPEIGEDELLKIASHGWDRIRFVWAGGLERGEPHYYRIQGPAFIIEYDNTQNNANHIHTTWRNLDGDFGRDLLREHYEHEHPGAR